MSNRFIYIFIISSVIFAFAMSFALSHLVTIPFWELFVDEFIHAVLFSFLAILVGQIINYGNFSALSFLQQIINYVALGVLTVAVWLSVGYGLFYLIFGENHSQIILNSLWIKGFVGMLVFLIFIQFYYNQQSKNEVEEDVMEDNKEQNALLQKTSEILERIAVKSGQKIHVILVSEIIYLQAEGDYVKIFTAKGKFLKEETMKYFQENLPTKQFVRVHRSYIVNVEMIHRIDVYEKQNQLLTLKNGEQIKASVAGYKTLKSALNL